MSRRDVRVGISFSFLGNIEARIKDALVGLFKEKAYFCNRIKHTKYMEMTREQAYQWLREVKQNKKNTIAKMTDWLVKDYEERTGHKPTYIETL